jgi:hypothetical protein
VTGSHVGGLWNAYWPEAVLQGGAQQTGLCVGYNGFYQGAQWALRFERNTTLYIGAAYGFGSGVAGLRMLLASDGGRALMVSIVRHTCNYVGHLVEVAEAEEEGAIAAAEVAEDAEVAEAGDAILERSETETVMEDRWSFWFVH